MLVVSRKKEETVVIDDGRIVVTLVAIKGDRARLGIEAPREIRVDRGEVHEARSRPAAENLDTPLPAIES